MRKVGEAVLAALGTIDDWGLSGTTADQYRSDLVADAAACPLLIDAGLGVLSEESGLHHGERPLLAVLDPVDGSTNASRAIPWYATSICILDSEGPRVALVVNQATGEAFEAVRGKGAWRNGEVLHPSGCRSLDEAIVGLAGWPSQYLGWRQMRALGAAALDMCSVACGRLDAYIDCSHDSHRPWDYLGALLVCQEAGAVAVDAFGRDLVARESGARRSPIAAATAELLAEAVEARTRLDASA